jgi:hypothetical protein
MLLVSSIALDRILRPIARSTDCGRVARAFADALIEGDAHLARSLAVTDASIDDWMSVRRGFSCPFSFFDETGIGMVCGYGAAGESNKWSCGSSYACLRGTTTSTLIQSKLELKPKGVG